MPLEKQDNPREPLDLECPILEYLMGQSSIVRSHLYEHSAVCVGILG
jgi:hypothetical protein